VSIPGPRSAELARNLRTYEQRNVTFLADDFPIFWDSARGATVTDVDGNRYIDCTAAFGVANAGHCNPHVIGSIGQQSERLMHGMGDVHPTSIRVRLFERLAEIMPAGLTKMFLATTGSEAIEAALKSAMLATGKSRFAAYRGAYHGLSFGALSVGGIERFRAPFTAGLGAEPLLLEYPRSGALPGAAQAASDARDALRARSDIAALVIEPVQGRAGCIVPPPEYLARIRAVCDDLRIVMIVDEIFTGFGRTGAWFAVDREGIVPDILCIGKAMGSGIPISAAIGLAHVMDAWPLSTGEALHTSTYLGNPLGCAAALATIDEIERLQLPARAAQLGAALRPRLDALRSNAVVVDVRGCGLLWGIELRDAAVAFAVVKGALARGVIFSQTGLSGDTIAITPPLTIDRDMLDCAIQTLELTIGETAAR
jgi:4-aminobutyrate aminotransferase-like enzyme